MFQTTRRRLALWYTAITAIVLLVFASGMYIYVRSTLIERIDDTLNHVVEVVGRSLTIETANPFTIPPQLRIDVAASFQDNADSFASPEAIRLDDDRIDLELFSSRGELMWSTLDEPLDLPLHINPDGETIHVPGERILRQITTPVMRNGQLLGFLRVSHPWFEVTKPTQLLIVDLSIGTCITIGTIAAIGWFLSGIAIEPVKAAYQQLKQFTADASHELRSPIASIQTNVQVALSEEPLSPEHRQQLQTIERLTRRLGRLVDDLLFLARQDSGIVQPKFSLVPLDGLLMEVVEEQQLVAVAKGIDLHLDPHEPQSGREDANIFTLSGDRDGLARLFTNLIANAIQYTPAAKDEHIPTIAIELQQLSQQNHTYLQVRVKDPGIGISTSDLPHLFDRFYRVDPARTSESADRTSGSGLGLAIVQAIVSHHHGEIAIDSQVNIGTTVTVTLPV
jgi:two-component system, OmpR family, manganese sensing sensor histidine kinase